VTSSPTGRRNRIIALAFVLMGAIVVYQSPWESELQ
jgi:hypothetical protein